MISLLELGTSSRSCKTRQAHSQQTFLNVFQSLQHLWCGFTSMAQGMWPIAEQAPCAQCILLFIPRLYWLFQAHGCAGLYMEQSTSSRTSSSMTPQWWFWAMCCWCWWWLPAVAPSPASDSNSMMPLSTCTGSPLPPLPPSRSPFPEGTPRHPPWEFAHGQDN